MADTVNVNSAPYNDRFDSTKNRNKVLFRPDRPLQQAELNEVQSIMENNVKNLGNSLFKDGAIQTGMAFSIDSTNHTLTVADGSIYLAGRVRQFTTTILNGFTGVGQENIGVKIVQSTVDYNVDPTLLDQTQNVQSYLSPGADRLVETVQLTYNDSTAPTIYQFNDGKLFIDPNRPEFSIINTVLAQRTYEESGSYQVDGFNMWAEASQTAGMVDLLIDKGIAYVLGYRISKPNSTRVQVAKSTTTAHVTQETYTYSTASGKITIGSNYVKGVTTVVARTQSPAGGVNISKGALDGRDAIPAQYTNIDPLTLTVYAGATVYRVNTDFTLAVDTGVQYINWNTGMNGTEPSVGTTYTLSFEYDRVMTVGTDFKVTTTALPNNQPGATTVVDFNGMAGVKPKDTGLVRVDYDYYLARMDLITLDQSGNFTVIQGQPARDGNATPPENIDPLTLIMGRIYLYPNSNVAKAQNTAVTNLKMADLQKMLARLENVEYNQSVILLETQATQSEDPLTLRGVFVDAFTDFTKMDPTLCSVALSFDDASMTLPTNTPSNQKFNPSFSAIDSVAHSWGRIVTAPFTELVEINQPLATSAWNVNPYQVYNKQGVLKVTPTSDNWIDETSVTVDQTAQVTTSINRWWAHSAEGDPNGKLSDFNQNLVNNTSLVGGAAWNSSSLGFGIRNQADGIMISTAQSTVDNAIMYMRQMEINFTLTNMKPNADSLFLTFDGVRVNVTPTGSSLAGSDSGTIRADMNGQCTGKFTIPSGVRCGTREVTIQNSENQATATFTSQGTNKVTTETITTTHVTFNLYDPLAQSFALNQAKVITSVGVFFGSKSSTNNIIMQIRGLSDGGFPNQTVYAERLLTPSQINVSADGSVETKIALDDPLMVKAGQSYCIVFISDSPDYTMYAATLGKPQLGSGATVTSQPYVNGVLFDSSNGVSWTLHQETDLKFKVYTASFQPTGTIQFNPMTSLDSNGILLLASYLTPANTGCNWEVRVLSSDQTSVSIDSVPWVPISNYMEQQPPYLVSTAQLRATFMSNRYISPMLALDDLLFVNFVSQTAGDYVTLTVDQTEAPFNTLTLSYDVTTPTGTTVTPYYSIDGGQNWVQISGTPSSSKVSAEYNRLTYVQTVATGTATYSSLKLKLHLAADNRFVRPRVRRLTALTKHV